MQMIQLMGEPSVGRQQLGKCAVDSVTTDEMKGAKGTEFLEALDSAISDGQDKEVDPNGLIAQLIALDLFPGPMPDQSINVGKLGLTSAPDGAMRIDNRQLVVQAFANHYNPETGEVSFGGIIRDLNNFGLQIDKHFGKQLEQLVVSGARPPQPSGEEQAYLVDLLQGVNLKGSQEEVQLLTAIISALSSHFPNGGGQESLNGTKPGKVELPGRTSIDIFGAKPTNANGAREIPTPVTRPNLKSIDITGAKPQVVDKESSENGSRPIPGFTGAKTISHLLSSSQGLKQLFSQFGGQKIDIVDGRISSITADVIINESGSLSQFTERLAMSLNNGARPVIADQTPQPQPQPTPIAASVAMAQALREPATTAGVDPAATVIEAQVPIAKGIKNTLPRANAAIDSSEEQEASVDSDSVLASEVKSVSPIKKSAEFAPQLNTELEAEAEEFFASDSSVEAVKQDDTTANTQPLFGKAFLSRGVTTVQMERADTAVLNHANELAEAVSDLIASKRPSSIKIELNPQDLGTIEVSVRQVGRRADVELRASDEGVRQSLQSHRQELVQSIESKGTSLGSLNVGQHDGNHAGQHGHSHRDTMKDSLNQAAHLSRFGTTTETQSMAQPSYRSSLTGRVDYSA